MFSSDGLQFTDVPHINNDEKAFGTRNPDTSPGKQLQALTDRTQYLKNKIDRLNIGNSTQPSIFELLSPLSQLLDDDGKLPKERLLATDNQGNITTIAIPRISFTRIAIASFSTAARSNAVAGQWAERPISRAVSTKPSGVDPQWLTSNGRTLTLNSPGQYLVEATGIAAMVDSHQLRLRRQPDDSFYYGFMEQTANEPVGGHTILTPSSLSAAFTIGVEGAPPPPITLSLQHWVTNRQPGFAQNIDFGFPLSRSNSVPNPPNENETYIVGNIIHIAIQTLSITDNKAIITDFNTP